jgi:predicted pyridoxine 5'-phosphate oxidase superfamily flavin-nucleotide-binding protein
MSRLYHEGNRELQDRFDSRRLADRLEEVTFRTAFTDADREFIAAMDMLFLATADADGHPNCSYKGGDPGFVRVVGDSELAIPDYDGNGMFLSWGNVVANPHVGMLFISFTEQRRMRVNGTASLRTDDPLQSSYPGARMIVRVDATQIFPNCPRYIHRMELVERSVYVPRAEVPTPEPSWKSNDWARDVLPRRPGTSD